MASCECARRGSLLSAISVTSTGFRAIADQSTLMEDMVKRVEGTRRAITNAKTASAQVSELADRFRV